MADKPSKDDSKKEDGEPSELETVVNVENVAVKPSMREETFQERREQAAEIVAKTGRRGSKNIRTTVPGSKKTYSKISTTDENFRYETWKKDFDESFNKREITQYEEQVKV